MQPGTAQGCTHGTQACTHRARAWSQMWLPAHSWSYISGSSLWFAEHARDADLLHCMSSMQVAWCFKHGRQRNSSCAYSTAIVLQDLGGALATHKHAGQPTSPHFSLHLPCGQDALHGCEHGGQAESAPWHVLAHECPQPSSRPQRCLHSTCWVGRLGTAPASTCLVVSRHPGQQWGGHVQASACGEQWSATLQVLAYRWEDKVQITCCFAQGQLHAEATLGPAAMPAWQQLTTICDCIWSDQPPPASILPSFTL